MENDQRTQTKPLNATVWIYPKAGGVQLYPKVKKGSLSITDGIVSLKQDDGVQILSQNVASLVKVSRWSSIMTLQFTASKVQIDFRKPLKWYQRLIPFGVLTIGWRQQLRAEKPFEDYFASIGVLGK